MKGDEHQFKVEYSITHYLDSHYERFDMANYYASLPRWEYQSGKEVIPAHLRDLPEGIGDFNEILQIIRRKPADKLGHLRLVACNSPASS